MNQEDRLLSQEEVIVHFGLSRTFVERWTGSAAADAWKKKDSKVPPMPSLSVPTTRFHVPSVREWLLKHFQSGGAA